MTDYLLTDPNESKVTDDVIDMLAQHPRTERLPITDILRGLRRSAGALSVPSSGRKWRIGGNPSDLVYYLETIGFTVTRVGNTRFISL